MTAAKYGLAVISASAVIAIFAFWAVSIWTGDQRWGEMAMLSFFASIPFTLVTGFLWTEASIR